MVWFGNGLEGLDEVLLRWQEVSFATKLGLPEADHLGIDKSFVGIFCECDSQKVNRMGKLKLEAGITNLEEP